MLLLLILGCRVGMPCTQLDTSAPDTGAALQMPDDDLAGLHLMLKAAADLAAAFGALDTTTTALDFTFGDVRVEVSRLPTPHS